MKQVEIKLPSLIFFSVFVIILSFRAFALHLTPFLNSDLAVHVLMAYDLKLPEDLYYWGQSRLGSLLPILAHGVLKIVPIAPIQAVSYVHYIFIVIGFFCFSSLLKQNLTKIIFSLVWFLPPAYFTASVEPVQPYSLQFSLIGISSIAIQHLMNEYQQHIVRKVLLILVAVSGLFLSLWVSDLSIVTIFLLTILLLYRFLKPISFSLITILKQRATLFSLLYIALLSLGWSAFIVYAKLHASKVDLHAGLVKLNGISSTIKVIYICITSIKNTILFSINNVLFSIYAIGYLLILTYLIIKFSKRFKASLVFDQFWMILFGLNALINLSLVLTSRWVYLNQVDSRYFAAVYIPLWLFVLLFFDRLDPFRTQSTLVAILLIVILGSASSSHQVFSFKKPDSTFSELRSLEKLGQAGFIGDYWTAYLMCSVDPKNFSCTPHQDKEVRCFRCVDRVLKAPVIYLIKEKWLNTFPLEIQQFGRRLRKQGKAQKISGYTFAPYEIVQTSKG